MRVVVDASVLVAELLRARGRQRLADARLELSIAEATWAEVGIELPRRVGVFAEARSLDLATAHELAELCLEAIETNTAVVDEPVYSVFEDEARARTPRDPHDWPLVACALALDAAIWTSDNDLLGSGVPTWTTTTLQAWLDRHPDG